MASLVAPKLPEVESFLLEGIVPGVVGGEDWCGSGDTTFQSRDPGSGELLAEVHAYTAADVNRSVEKANESFKKSGWSTLAPNDRAVRLHRFADLVEQQKKVRNNREYDSLTKEIEYQGLEVELAEKRINEYKARIASKQELLETSLAELEDKKGALGAKKNDLAEIEAET